jgi:hypothetical protein
VQPTVLESPVWQRHHPCVWCEQHETVCSHNPGGALRTADAQHLLSRFLSRALHSLCDSPFFFTHTFSTRRCRPNVKRDKVARLTNSCS